MKLSQMNTDQIADVYCIAAPALETIVSGKAWQKVTEETKGEVTTQALLLKILPALLKENRKAVYTVIGAFTGKEPEEIAKQSFPQTLKDAREFLDEDFADFFSQFVSEEAKE